MRSETLSGTKFRVEERIQKAEDNEHKLESKQWFLLNEKTGGYLSSWHDIEMKGAADNTITGVIEITRGTQMKLEVSKTLPGNPLMQDYTK